LEGEKTIGIIGFLISVISIIVFIYYAIVSGQYGEGWMHNYGNVLAGILGICGFATCLIGLFFASKTGQNALIIIIGLIIAIVSLLLIGITFLG